MRNSTQNESRIFVAKTESLNFNVSTGFFFSTKFTFDQLLCPSGRPSPTSTTATVRSSGTERSSENPSISTISTTFIYYPEKVKREAASRRVNDSGESFYRDCTVPLVVLIGVVIGIIIVVVILVVLKMTNK